MCDVYSWMIREQIKQGNLGGKKGPLAYFEKVEANRNDKKREKAYQKSLENYRKLIITVHSGSVASGLNLDDGDLADPFVKIGKANEKGLFKKSWFACTPVEKKTLSPNWQFHHSEILDFHSVKKILIELWDEDMLSRNDFIGRCTVDISSLNISNIVKQTYKVYSTNKDGVDTATGSITITLSSFPLSDNERKN